MRQRNMSNNSPGSFEAEFDLKCHLEDFPTEVYETLLVSDKSVTPPPAKRRKMCVLDDDNRFYSEAQVNLITDMCLNTNDNTNNVNKANNDEITEELSSSTETDTLKSISVLRSAEHIDNVSDTTSFHCSHLIDMQTKSVSANASEFDLCQLSHVDEVKVFRTILPYDQEAEIKVTMHPSPRTLEVPRKRICIRDPSPKPKSIWTKVHQKKSCSSAPATITFSISPCPSNSDLNLGNLFVESSHSFKIQNFLGILNTDDSCQGDNNSMETQSIDIKESLSNITTISSPSTKLVSRNSSMIHVDDEVILTEENVMEDTLTPIYVATKCTGFEDPNSTNSGSLHSKVTESDKSDRSRLSQILDSLCKLLSMISKKSKSQRCTKVRDMPKTDLDFNTEERKPFGYEYHPPIRKSGPPDEECLTRALSEMAVTVFKSNRNSFQQMDGSDNWDDEPAKSHMTYSEAAATLKNVAVKLEKVLGCKGSADEQRRNNVLFHRRAQAIELNFYNVEMDCKTFSRQHVCDFEKNSDANFNRAVNSNVLISEDIEDETGNDTNVEGSSCCSIQYWKNLFFPVREPQFFQRYS